MIFLMTTCPPFLQLNFRNQYDRRKNARSVMRSPRQLKPVSRSQSLPAVAVLDDSPPKSSVGLSWEDDSSIDRIYV